MAEMAIGCLVFRSEGDYFNAYVTEDEEGEGKAKLLGSIDCALAHGFQPVMDNFITTIQMAVSELVKAALSGEVSFSEQEFFEETASEH